MKPPTSIAWENGPTGGQSSGEVIAVLLMENSCGYWVRWSEWLEPEVARASYALWASAASSSGEALTDVDAPLFPKAPHRTARSRLLFVTEDRYFNKFIIINMILP